MVTYPDPNLEDDIFDVGTEASGTDTCAARKYRQSSTGTGTGVNTMTSLPGSIFTNLMLIQDQHLSLT